MFILVTMICCVLINTAVVLIEISSRTRWTHNDDAGTITKYTKFLCYKTLVDFCIYAAFKEFSDNFNHPNGHFGCDRVKFADASII